ncbi:TonB family protein [Acinetobacter tjernbergiae]|uniref:Uncharacterized protein n=1 Tax=Acinetobacter tjernbergiae DSM 14971 = CIP 107465 TaxID=1120928 RepID=V2UH13_9GAMM|nr:TonB family protein [Acinetobacter tjernbergiae]ESK54033.1 hypothetical protein F990_02989 [Acinetobacter tjernbergiae DSM 14971 = CIP 107465]
MTTQSSNIETAISHQTMTSSFEIPAWLPWFFTRLLSGVLVVFVISLIVFIATQALPSDPARVILGPEAPEATVQILREQLGLNDPILIQYWHWLSQLLQGNFGRSIDSNVPVVQIVQNYFGNTVALTILVIVITVPLSVVLGVWLSLRRDSKLDRIIVSSSILFKAVPGFVIAIWLMMFFSTSILHILPAASLLIPEQSAFSQIEFLVLPILTLALSLIPYLMHLVRGSMIDALESDYVTSARLRGIPERRIIWKHVLPNALVPVVQGTALTIRVLLSGALIIEVVFSYLSNPAPEYPEQALERGWEGSVILRVKVLANGSPDTVSVKQSSGKKLLDSAAVRTVKQWKFSPALKGKTPVEGWVDVPIHYQLPK